jgi:hypothetical protein
MSLFQNIMSADASFKKLNRVEFASALQRGLGRALLHVRHYGLDGVSDLVLQDCLHDQAYDAQCEGNKAKWLFSMINNTEYYQDFSNMILKALETETDTWDLQQLFALSKELALAGNDYARNHIRDRALKIAEHASSDDWPGAQEWIEIGGVEAMLELVRIYGRRLISDPEDYVPTDEVFPECTISRKYRMALFKYAQAEPEIKAYFEYMKKGGSLKRISNNLGIVNSNSFQEEAKKQKSYREQIRQEYNVGNIIDAARNKKGEYPGHYMSFGRCATKEELVDHPD